MPEPIVFGYTPLTVHAPFHTSLSYERALFGAFGSGKTYALIAEVIAWCLEQPGIRGVVCRYTIPELRDSTEPIFLEMLPPALLAAGEIKRTGGHIERFVFPNGSTVLFRSLDDWNKWRSLNLGFLAIDEANEIDEESYQGVRSRVRQRDITAEARKAGYTHEITRRGIWMATNPNGHDWIWERFVDKPEDGTAWFKSTSFDNPFLTPDYLNMLLSYPEPWVRRYVLCTFDDFGGAIFPDWQWETHVIEPPKLEGSEVFWMGMDPGTRNPTAGLWVVVDKPNRRLIGVDEYQANYTSAATHAAAWRQIEAKHRMNVRWRVADPTVMTTERATGNMTLHDIYRRLGYNFALGPRMHRDRIPPLQLLIAQGRFLVTKNCPMAYEAIKRYRWEDITPAMRAKGTTPPEKPLTKDDHLVDCAEYLASRWINPGKLKQPPPPEYETPMQALSAEILPVIRRQQRHKARVRSRGHGHELGGIRL